LDTLPIGGLPYNLFLINNINGFSAEQIGLPQLPNPSQGAQRYSRRVRSKGEFLAKVALIEHFSLTGVVTSCDYAGRFLEFNLGSE
jgi:hypothetical protein